MYLPVPESRPGKYPVETTLWMSLFVTISEYFSSVLVTYRLHVQLWHVFVVKIATYVFYLYDDYTHGTPQIWRRWKHFPITSFLHSFTFDSCNFAWNSCDWCSKSPFCCHSKKIGTKPKSAWLPSLANSIASCTKKEKFLRRKRYFLVLFASVSRPIRAASSRLWCWTSRSPAHPSNDTPQV